MTVCKLDSGEALVLLGENFHLQYDELSFLIQFVFHYEGAQAKGNWLLQLA